MKSKSPWLPLVSAAVVLLILAPSVPLRGQEVSYLRVDAFEELTRKLVVETAELLPTSIECPEQIPLQKGSITPCRVQTEQGRPLVAHVEQTDAEGTIWGTLEDPSAVEAVETLRAPFLKALEERDVGAFYDRWASELLRAQVPRDNFAAALHCRADTLGKVTVVRRVGASLSDGGAKGRLILHLQSSRALPRRVSLLLAKGEAGWQLDGFEFPPPLPQELPPPAFVRERAQGFLQAFSERRFGDMLAPMSPDFELQAPKIRPLEELALRREILGGVAQASPIDLGVSEENGRITARANVRLERTPGRVEVRYLMCGGEPHLMGYTIQSEPEAPLGFTADQLARSIELELWRNNYGEVEVACPDDQPIASRPGLEITCQAQRGDERARAIVTFEDVAGGMDITMKPLEN